jgi:C-terminal processing protease CtpA/Prc
LYFLKDKTPDGQHVVTKVIDFRGNPYKEAGLKEGDEIFTINDKIFKDLTFEDRLELNKADTLRYVFLRDREPITIIVPVDKYYASGD